MVAKCFIMSLSYQLFAGLLISLDSLPVWVSWVQHISFIQYGVEVNFFSKVSMFMYFFATGFLY